MKTSLLTEKDLRDFSPIFEQIGMTCGVIIDKLSELQYLSCRKGSCYTYFQLDSNSITIYYEDNRNNEYYLVLSYDDFLSPEDFIKRLQKEKNEEERIKALERYYSNSIPI